MLKSLMAISALLCAPLLSLVVQQDSAADIPEGVSLMSLRQTLGEDYPSHYRLDPSLEQIDLGRQLIHEGRADLPEGKSAYISKFYACTSCHNTVREDPDLTLIDPAARLQYAADKGIPYLQASTFWGIVNRNEWYNNDYVKKYGDLVIAANKSLEGSIQLCAQECSQGRELEAWEMEAILAYFSSLEVLVDDLSIEPRDVMWLYSEEGERSEKLDLLDESFLDHSPAHFIEPPHDKSKGYDVAEADIDLELGGVIYAQSCGHCHREDGVSDLVLDKSRKTARWLKKNFAADSRYSLYEIIRHGTYAEYGHREYMPQYTQEKMSNAQVESLRAYIEFLAD